jgi:hypothetical protein
LRIHAYVLAADPTWLATSVRAYYPHVEKLVVSYDQDGIGWAGGPIRVEACLAALRLLDVDRKIEWAGGRFHSFGRAGRDGDTLARDTRQRRAALELASSGADWVLHIDTDEVLPRWEALLSALKMADDLGLSAVEWPLRVLYRQLPKGKYLEVVTSQTTTHYEYGSIAVRPGTQLVECRRSSGPYLRPVVMGDRFSLHVRRPLEDGEHRAEMLSSDDAIWHNSWARPARAVRSKIASWGHNQGLRTWFYYYAKWLPAPVTWRALRDFHPLYPPLWPRLAVIPELPFELEPIDGP